MSETVTYTFVVVLPALLTLLVGIVLLVLRFKAGPLPTTQVQRWGMVLLAWLFIMNSLLAFTWLANQYSESYFTYFVWLDMPVIGPAFLLGFAFVFPQPIVRQSRIWLLFLGLAVVTGIIVLLEVGNNVSIESIMQWRDIQNVWIYVGWFGSLIRWMQMYRKSRHHPEISLISSVLIWCVLYHVLITFLFYKMSGMPFSEIPGYVVFGLDLRQFLALVFLVVILHQLYERRGKWQLAEKLHVFMICFLVGLTVGHSLLVAAIQGGTPVGPVATITGYLIAEGGMMIVRPALIIYALMRFQFFGHELRAERYIVLLATLMISFFCSLFISFFFIEPGTSTQGSAGLVAFFLLLYPSYIGARRLVFRVIPSTKGITRKDARDLYFISFYSSLFKGRVEDARDREALASLRKRLKISDREHSLLLESERMRAAEGKVVNQVRYATLVRDTGQHVASYGPIGGDETVLASMLTAVRMFVKDAFGSATGDLDTIQYGNQKLVMEWERGYILAADLEGEIDPASRVIVGDILAVLMRRHWKVLNDWDGDMKEVRPVQEDLDRLIYNYNKTGSL